MRILTSWDDGAESDLRIANLLREYELPGIFFISQATNMLSEAEIRAIADDFELGGHTTSHPADIKRMRPWEAEEDIRINKEWLEDIGGKELEWFCYPRGRHNEEIREVVRDLGFRKARTTWVNNFAEAEDSMMIHPTIHVHPSRKEYKGEDWLARAVRLYDLAKNSENSYYHIWGHSWEIDQHDTWDELEALLAYIYND